MKLLAIDSSSRYFSMGIEKNDCLLVRVLKPFGRELSRKIMPSVESALKKANIPLAQFDCFGIGLGPGSFTGLRIGLATLKGLLFSRNKPVVSIPSLDILAYALRGHSGVVCPVIDAKRGLVYCALYEAKQGKIQRKSRYLLVPIKEVVEKVKAKEAVFFLGDGLTLYQNTLEKGLGKRARFILEEKLWYPQPENLLALIKEKYKRREFSDIEALVPLYLYPKECQITR